MGETIVLAYLDPGSGPPILTIVVVLVLLYVVPAFLVASYAKRKGHSFGLFLLLGLVTSWIISLIVALVVEHRGVERPVGAVGTAAAAPSTSGRADELQKLSDLRDAGTLSDEEFERAKVRLLNE